MPEHAGTWGQSRRLEFIDFRLLWEGRINRADVTTFFGVSVPQASLDLARYFELAPHNAEYDRSSKVYVASERFAPVLTTGDPDRYLTQLAHVTAGILPPEKSFIGWYPACETVRLPARRIRNDVLSRVLLAMRRRTALEIEYQSFNRPAPGRRAISPHALGFDGFRWHARAYCHERNSFRDFVLGRILRIFRQVPTEARPEEDAAWHRIVRLVLVPHPGLPPGQRRAIELDYGMRNGQAVLESRQALLFYVLQQLGVATRPPTPQAQQIVLSNRDEIEQLIQDFGQGGVRP